MFKNILTRFQSKSFGYLILFWRNSLENYLKCFFFWRVNYCFQLHFLSAWVPLFCTTAFYLKCFQCHLISKSCVLSCSCYIWTALWIYSPFWWQGTEFILWKKCLNTKIKIHYSWLFWLRRFVIRYCVKAKKKATT